MTAILDTPTAPAVLVEQAPAPRGLCAALPLAPQAASGCPMNGGGEFCPTDQKTIDQCTAC